MTQTSPDYSFGGKTRATIQATTGNIIRVWDDTPDVATVPATDSQDKRFEFVFAGALKDLFEQSLRAGIEAGGVEISATGFWRKRTWRKTRTTGGWGHTWQFVAATWTVDGQTHGTEPRDMKDCAVEAEID